MADVERVTNWFDALRPGDELAVVAPWVVQRALFRSRSHGIVCVEYPTCEGHPMVFSAAGTKPTADGRSIRLMPLVGEVLERCERDELRQQLRRRLEREEFSLETLRAVEAALNRTDREA